MNRNTEQQVKAKDGTVFPSGKVLKDKVIEIIRLRSDIAYAIGHAQGCGHPVKYLEKKYPDLVVW